MRIKYFLLLPLLVLFTNLCLGDDAFTGWWIFRMPQSTKPNSLNYIPYNYDLFGAVYNPSVLGALNSKEILFNTETGFTTDVMGGFLYGIPFAGGNGSGISFGLIYYDAGQVVLSWMEGTQENERTVSIQKDILGIVSYGIALNDTKSVLFGSTLKAANSNIAEIRQANALAVDLGVTLQTKRSVFYSTIQNLGTATKFINEANELPAGVTLGLTHIFPFGESSFIATGFDVPYIFSEGKATPDLAIGINLSHFAFNIGYKLNVEDAALQVGLSLKTGSVNIGYSFTSSAYIASTHRVSIGYKSK